MTRVLYIMYCCMYFFGTLGLNRGIQNMGKLLKPTGSNLWIAKIEFINYCEEHQDYIFTQDVYDLIDVMVGLEDDYVYTVSNLYSYIHTAYAGISKIYLEDIKDYAIQYINSEIASRKHYLTMTGELK